MNIARAMERAQAIKPSQRAKAADLYADIDFELAYGDVPEDDYRRAEDALALLEERFPGIRHMSTVRVEDGRLPNMSAAAKESMWNEGAAATGTAVVPAQSAAVPSQAVAKVAQRRERRRRERVPLYPRRAARALDQVSGGWGSLVMTGIVTAGGLAILYLVVAGRGPQGLARLFRGFTNLLGWIISPNVDPLNPPKGVTTA